MYEAPKLIVVGDAQEVILGSSDTGTDLDGTYYFPDWEYGNDSVARPRPPDAL